MFAALQDPTIDSGFSRLQKLIPRHPGDPDKLPKVRTIIVIVATWRFFSFISYDNSFTQEIILNRAADLAEMLYNMPRNNQFSLAPRSPTNNGGMTSASFYSSGQLAVTVPENGSGQWTEGSFQTFEFAILRNASAALIEKVSFIAEEFARGQSSSVSPRGGYGSSASTPHSSNGGGSSYNNGTTNGGGNGTPAGSIAAGSYTGSSANTNSNLGSPTGGSILFNSSSSEYQLLQNCSLVFAARFSNNARASFFRFSQQIFFPLHSSSFNFFFVFICIFSCVFPNHFIAVACGNYNGYNDHYANNENVVSTMREKSAFLPVNRGSPIPVVSSSSSSQSMAHHITSASVGWQHLTVHS